MSKKIKTLVVDDSLDTLELLERKLEKKKLDIITTNSVVNALTILKEKSFDLVITDNKMPEISGLELIKHINQNYRHIKVIMITGYPTIDGAVDAVKTGAEEYLTKPFTDDELYKAIDSVITKIRSNQMTPSNDKKDYFIKHGIVGRSKVMQSVFRIIEKSAPTDASVLITGESGTGKELVARAIHYHPLSKRKSAPFVPINCGAIPENLLESELFGYVKGSFTGAVETRAGFFITADGGTIFLDEIGETSLSMQVKLLRVLQDKQVCMVGSKNFREVNVRIITATNKNLLNLVNQGKFREDLYYRLNVISVEIPPLREREDDIILLTKYFFDKFAKDADKVGLEISDEILEMFKKNNWSGNVRELENVINRIVILSDHKKIESADLPDYMRYTAKFDRGLERTLEEVEFDHIKNVLDMVCGNKTKAAEILGIDRKTLRSKLSKQDSEDGIK